MLFAKTGEVVVNEDSGDQDFRVESDSLSHALFVDAGGNKIGINTSSPSALFDVNGDIHANNIFRNGGTTDTFTVSQGTSTIDPSLALWGEDHAAFPGQVHIVSNTSNAAAGSGLVAFYEYDGSGSPWNKHTTFGKSGYVFNETSRDRDFRVESDNSTHAIFVDSGNNRVGLFTGSPATSFQVNGTTLFHHAGTISSQANAQLVIRDADSTNMRANFIVEDGTNGDRGGLMIQATEVGVTNDRDIYLNPHGGRVGILTSQPEYAFHAEGASKIGGGVTQAAPSATNILSTSHAILGGQGGNALHVGQYPSAQSHATWMQSSYQVPNTAKYNLVLQPLGGAVIIGAATQTAQGRKLEITDNVATYAHGPVKIQNTSTSAQRVMTLNTENNGNTDMIVFDRDNGNRGSISCNGTSISYNTTSDYRLKENVTDLSGAITRVKALEPKRFNFIDKPDLTVDGFLAHEAQTVVPEAVTGIHNEVVVWGEGEELPDGVSVGDNRLDEDGNTIPKYQSIDQAKLVPLLTAALQEAITKIETLETQRADMEARLAALESA